MYVARLSETLVQHGAGNPELILFRELLFAGCASVSGVAALRERTLRSCHASLVQVEFRSHVRALARLIHIHAISPIGSARLNARALITRLNVPVNRLSLCEYREQGISERLLLRYRFLFRQRCPTNPFEIFIIFPSKRSHTMRLHL